ncbi:MAG: YqgE/AlgH family protein [Ketobacteraceae bacterium]|nr:YqgE/AlgH family protein [Ketobacteraceae bacterium]
MATSADITIKSKKSKKIGKKSNRVIVVAALVVAIVIPVSRHLLKTGDYIQALAPGRLLEAVSGHHGGLFKNTRVLLVHYSPRGATGVVLNEPLIHGLSRYENPPSLSLSDTVKESLFWGGPLEIDQAYRVIQGYGDQPFVRVLAHAEEPVSAPDRIYLGFAGWNAGQLEREIRRGDWRVLPDKRE